MKDFIIDFSNKNLNLKLILKMKSIKIARSLYPLDTQDDTFTLIDKIILRYQYLLPILNIE